MQEPAPEDLAMFEPMIETVTVVKSSESLLAAVRRGDGHMQLQAHLNLTGIGDGLYSGIGEVPWAVQSIQVRAGSLQFLHTSQRCMLFACRDTQHSFAVVLTKPSTESFSSMVCMGGRLCSLGVSMPFDG